MGSNTGGVGLHLAVDLRSGSSAVTISTARRTCALTGGVGAEVREGQHGHPWHDAEAAGEADSEQGDLRQLLGSRIDVDRGVSEEEEAVLKDENVGA